MNNTLANLADSFLNNGTGDIMLYYDFKGENTGAVGNGSNFTGTVKNVSPSSTVGSYDGLVLDATGSTTSSAVSSLSSIFLNDSSGIDLRLSNIEFGSFSGSSFLDPSDFESEFVFMFSFEKLENTNGVLIGSLQKDEYDDGNISFVYGRGFNLGINNRNHLFFQGIDSNLGEYVLVADELELANKNICSARISPYEVSFSLYNLADDEFTQQNLRTDSKIQNINWGENFYLGGSPTYLRNGRTFDGAIDELILISGAYGPTDLKSIASGFVATGIQSSGSSFQDEVITGYSIELIAPVGITGYTVSITGYSSIRTDSELVEFVLSGSESAFEINEGGRFFTGYSLPNNSGDYLEETSFLLKDNLYSTSGDGAHATLGLKNSGVILTEYSLVSTKIVSSQESFPIYGVVPVTGFLLDSPTGYSKTYLTKTITKTGSILENLSFIDDSAQSYKHDYLYYTSERI